jgi:hypothetical protein
MKKIKEFDISLMLTAQVICTIVTIITEYHINIQPDWIKDIICVLISCTFSLTFVFGILKNIILSVWTKANKKYYLGGKWYVIYHEDSDTPRYIRSGTVNLKQYIDKIKMYNLLMHTPSIKNGEIVGLDDNSPRDTESKHRISTGSGEYVIDFENLLLKGFFNLFRDENNGSIMGLDICTIHKANYPYKSPQHLSGNFYNAEKGRSKPTNGIITLYKNKDDAKNYIRSKLNCS